MKKTNEQFETYDCIKLENDSLCLWVTQDVGPRIIGLQVRGGSNLLAVVPQASAVTPAGNVYRFRGGHRLWCAPEHPEDTYVPDDTAVTIKPLPDGIQTIQAVDPLTSIEKQMRITLPDQTAVVIIEHTLTNRGNRPAVLAPWALTQLKPGGFAILPLNNSDTGLLPNRRLIFWPYADLTSNNLQWGNRFLIVHATMKQERFKIGWPNLDGWLGYWNDNVLFIKEAVYLEGREYFDDGASSECYCDDRFLELETLGPRETLAPQTAVSHREVWRLFPDVTLTPEESAVTSKLSQLGIIDEGKNDNNLYWH